MIYLMYSFIFQSTTNFKCSHLKNILWGSSHRGTVVNKSDWEPWGCGFDPWSYSVGLGSGVAVSCGVGRRRGSDSVLLWLWCRPVAVAPIRPLAWEPPCTTGEALEKTKKIYIHTPHTHIHTHLLWGVPWCLSRLRICHCHCCGAGSVPGLGTSTCHWHGQIFYICIYTQTLILAIQVS